MILVPRIGLAGEIDDAVLYLSRNCSCYSNGVVLFKNWSVLYFPYEVLKIEVCLIFLMRFSDVEFLSISKYTDHLESLVLLAALKIDYLNFRAVFETVDSFKVGLHHESLCTYNSWSSCIRITSTYWNKKKQM